MNSITIFGTVNNVSTIPSTDNTGALAVYLLAVPRGGNSQTWDYFNVSCYGKQAEFASSLKGGENVFVSGYLQDSGIKNTDTKLIIASQQAVMTPVVMPYPINHVIVMGRLTKDPELRKTNDGRPVANARIAVDRISRNQNQTEKSANYIDVISFDKTADFAEKFLKKGMKIIVTGYIRNNNYTNREGQTVYRDAIYATRIEFAESKSASANGTAQQQYGAPTAPISQAPYGAPMAQAPAAPYGAPMAQAPQAPQAPYGTPMTQAPAAPMTQAPAAPMTQAPAAPYGAPATPMTPTAPTTPTTPMTQAQNTAPTTPMAQAPQAPYGVPAAPMTQNPYGAPATPMTQAPAAPATPMTQTQTQTQNTAPAQEGFIPASTYMDNALPFA